MSDLDFDILFKNLPIHEEVFHRKQDVWNNLQQVMNEDGKKAQAIPRIWWRIYRYAAVFALLVVSSAILIFMSMQKISSDNGTVIAHLPDESEVTLYPHSEISYNSIIWMFSRDLDFNGKAFFKVSKGSRFTVHAKSGTVSVLGTQFMITESDERMSVECMEGKVNVASVSGEFVIITAGENATVTTTGVTKEIQIIEEPEPLPEPVVEEEPIQEPSVTGQIPDEPKTIEPVVMGPKLYQFTNAELRDVVSKFEKIYELTVTPKALLDGIGYSGSFSDDNLNNALIMIFAPCNISYSVDGKIVHIEQK